MSNLINLARGASATMAQFTQSAGRWSHLLFSFSDPAADLSKLSIEAKFTRKGGSEQIWPGVPLNAALEVADTLGLGGLAGVKMQQIQTSIAGGTGISPADPYVYGSSKAVFALPIGDRRIGDGESLAIRVVVGSSLTGTYNVDLFDDGAKRAQGLPVVFVAATAGSVGRPARMWAIRNAVQAAPGAVVGATDSSLKLTFTVEGEGTHVIGGGSLAALSALHDSATAPSLAALCYCAPDIQPQVSVNITGTDSANWSLLAMMIPDVNVSDAASDGAARAEGIVAAAAAIPADRRESLQFHGAMAKLSTYKEVANKFGRNTGKRAR